MKRINKILIGLILIASMFLGIGYSAISNITLDITGTISAGGVAEKKPYLPTGFNWVEGTSFENGLTIHDEDGNQYVWIEVPKTAEVYPTAGLEITSFSENEYEKIETDLNTYASTYNTPTAFKDIWYSSAQHGFTSADKYNEHKYKMLKSVYLNEGFYVGKYETGIADTQPDEVDTSHEARTAKGDATQKPVIQANAYPYNFVTCSQAQVLATSMESGEYTSSLMFGVQWNLVLRYLESKGVPQSELNSNSSSWGNNQTNLWTITNSSSKHYYGAWADKPYGTKANKYTNILVSTGADSSFSKQGIYDLAGNVAEWTLEYTTYTYYPCVGRGGAYNENVAASYATDFSATYTNIYNGFRVTIF